MPAHTETNPSLRSHPLTSCLFFPVPRLPSADRARASAQVCACLRLCHQRRRGPTPRAHLKVRRYGGSDMKIPVLDQYGKSIATLVAPFQKDARYSFTAPNRRVKLVCDAEATASTSTRRRADCASSASTVPFPSSVPAATSISGCPAAWQISVSSSLVRARTVDAAVVDPCSAQ